MRAPQPPAPEVASLFPTLIIASDKVPSLFQESQIESCQGLRLCHVCCERAGGGSLTLYSERVSERQPRRLRWAKFRSSTDSMCTELLCPRSLFLRMTWNWTCCAVVPHYCALLYCVPGTGTALRSQDPLEKFGEVFERATEKSWGNGVQKP
eukprot:92472-Rhodomonas_salina.2